MSVLVLKPAVLNKFKQFTESTWDKCQIKFIYYKYGQSQVFNLVSENPPITSWYKY